MYKIFHCLCTVHIVNWFSYFQLELRHGKCPIWHMTMQTYYQDLCGSDGRKVGGGGVNRLHQSAVLIWAVAVDTDNLSKYTKTHTSKHEYTINCLTLSTLGNIFSRRYIEIVFLFFPENRIWHFMQIVSLETICMKCQIPFLENTRKILPMCRLLS